MTIKGVIDEDFVNYKVPSMSIMFPKCTFKCGRENCQNKDLINSDDITVDIDALCERYINNPITEAVVCQGLEPFDSFDQLYDFIATLRTKYKCDDNIVIYSGYDKNEAEDKIKKLQRFTGVIVKYGRYEPFTRSRHDDTLGVILASENQYAEMIS